MQELQCWSRIGRAGFFQNSSYLLRAWECSRWETRRLGDASPYQNRSIGPGSSAALSALPAAGEEACAQHCRDAYLGVAIPVQAPRRASGNVQSPPEFKNACVRDRDQSQVRSFISFAIPSGGNFPNVHSGSTGRTLTQDWDD
jgi:hypothetical protein